MFGGIKMTVAELKQILSDIPDNAIVTIMSSPSNNLTKDDYDVENVIEYVDHINHETYICLF